LFASCSAFADEFSVAEFSEGTSSVCSSLADVPFSVSLLSGKVGLCVWVAFCACDDCSLFPPDEHATRKNMRQVTRKIVAPFFMMIGFLSLVDSSKSLAF
jgi:hypothetical protein